MKIIKIPKKSKGYRTIYVVKGQEGVKYRSAIGEIAKAAWKLDKDKVTHGFVRGRSPISAALVHVGYEWSVCFDLQDFFDNVDQIKLEGKLPKKIIDLVLVDGAARQGLPTSPAVANVAASAMDTAIMRLINKNKLEIVYTRYADDLTFSGNSLENKELVLNEIPNIISRCGWKLRKEKTHIQMSSHGRRHICGVAVDDNGINPTRRMKRILRAALHQAKKGNEESINQARGLSEWCKLKPPRDRGVINDEHIDDIKEQLTKLGKVWRIPIPKRIPDKGSDIIDGDLLITGDPVYILGCSTWTTGWKSCLAHPGGTKRRSSAWWCRTPGTRLSALLSNKTMDVAGVTRRIMRARTFIHTMRNGVEVYDRVYGECESRDELIKRLEARGIVSVNSISNGIEVIGNVTGKSKPYLDSLRSKIVNVRNGNKVTKAVVLHT